MTTPFWHNHKDSSPLAAAGDFQRDSSTIRLNGKTLLSIIVQKYELNVDKMSKGKIDALIKEHLTQEDTTEIFKTELFEFCDDLSLRHHYAETLSAIVHQAGFLRASHQALLNNPKLREKGYLLQDKEIKTVTNFEEKAGEVWVQETTELRALQKKKDNILIRKEDKSPMLTVKNQFRFIPEKAGQLSYEHTEASVESNHPLATALFKEEQVAASLDKNFKAIFSLHGLREQVLREDSSLKP